MIPLFGAEKPVDVSGVIPKYEAEKILGESVRNPLRSTSMAKTVIYSNCNYYSTKSVPSAAGPSGKCWHAGRLN
jgi:hypothetical protein